MPVTNLESISPVGALPESLAIQAYLVSGDFGAAQPVELGAVVVDDTVKSAVRSLLRWGGHKPSGRGRPASESLAKAVEDERWPTIHPLVDRCNLLSLYSGLPISVLDAGLLDGPLEIRVGQPGEEYVFNPSGQTLSLKGLLLVADSQGPTGGPVKDAQRSKVSEQSREFLIVVWGTSECPSAGAMVADGITEWCSHRGAPCLTVPVAQP